jgi:methylthioribose-1-phosphate isomerase
MRTIDWVDGVVEIIDQTALPGRTVLLRLSSVEELVTAIRTLAVRGAPALGVAGALGVALAARAHADEPAARTAVVGGTALGVVTGAARWAGRWRARRDRCFKVPG